MSFRIDLDIFRGPIDLLHFLVRKNEIEVNEISLAQITRQYQDYLDVLKEIDINQVGDFIAVAAQLVEIKTRQVLPRNEFESEHDDEEDPRQDLVERLLIYREFKETSSLLEEQSRLWQQRYARVTDDLPPRKVDVAEQPIREVELWDLVSAFGRVLRDNRPPVDEKVFYDETPIHVYMQKIHDRLANAKKVAFSEMFEPGMHKSSMVGVFLAVLELCRHHSVMTEQTNEHGEIWIVPGEDFNQELDLSNIDTYEGDSDGPSGDPASLVDKST